MFKRKVASRYLAISLTTLALGLSTQPSLVLAQTPETITAPLKRPTTVTVSGLIAENSSISEDQLRTILTDGMQGHEQALLDWNADVVTIPEVTVSIPGKTKKAKPTVITYRDVELRNVKNGAAETLSAGSIGTANKLGETLFELISFENVNFANIARIIAPEQSDTADFYPLFSSAKMNNGTFSSEEVSCLIGTVSSSEYQMRAVGQTISTLLDLSNNSKLDDIEDIALLAPLLTSYADLVTSVKAGPTEIANFSCTEVTEDPTNLDNPPDTLEIGTIHVAAIEPGLYPEIKATDIAALFEDQHQFAFKDLTFKALNFTGLLTALDAAPSPLTEEWIEENQRHLTPNFGGLAFNGMSFDDGNDDPISVTVEAFDLTLENYINGVPSKASVSATSIVSELPQDSSDEIFVMMRNAGFTNFDGSFRLAGQWNDADETIDIEEVSFDLKDMVSVDITAQLTNAQRLLFALDYKDAIRAGRALALQSISLDVTDIGIGEVILASVSGEMGVDANAMRPIYADLAKGTIVAYLADLAEASALGDAVSAFVAGTAKNLKIGVTAKSENGISLEEFEQAEDDPTAILSKINVTATAN